MMNFSALQAVASNLGIQPKQPTTLPGDALLNIPCKMSPRVPVRLDAVIIVPANHDGESSPEFFSDENDFGLTSSGRTSSFDLITERFGKLTYLSNPAKKPVAKPSARERSFWEDSKYVEGEDLAPADEDYSLLSPAADAYSWKSLSTAERLRLEERREERCREEVERLKLQNDVANQMKNL